MGWVAIKMSAEIKSRRKVQWWYSTTPRQVEGKKDVNPITEIDEGVHSAYMYRNLD